MSSPFRVAYILEQFPKLSETFVLNEMLEARRQGADVRLFARRRGQEAVVHETARPLVPETTYFEEVSRFRKWLSLFSLATRHPVHLARTVGFVARRRDRDLQVCLGRALVVARALERDGIQHVHAHFALRAAETSMLVGMLTGIPYSFTAHAVDIYVYPRMLAEKMRRARFVVTTCDYTRLDLQKIHPLPSERFALVRIGMDPGAFPELVKREADSGEPLQLLSVARLVEKKGLRYLVDAVARLRSEGLPLRLRIAGDGPEGVPLQAEIERQGLSGTIELVGPVNGDGVRALLRETDVFVLPCVIASNGDRDATPTVFSEAMGSGRPVISTTVAGVPEVVPPSAGVLVPPEDSESLADAIRMLHEMGPEERSSMGARGRAHALESFNLQAETKKLLERMQSALPR